ncbi:MAG: hypothetical protein AB7W16_18145 [Candidatus Obscuribacterales bacterium]
MTVSIRRDSRGGNMAELPAVLFVIFIVFFLPLVNIGTTALRYSLLLASCKEGVHAAATASTFEQSSPGKPSSQESASESVYDSISKFSGLYVDDIELRIVAVSKATGAVTVYSGKLAQPANTRDNLYFIESAVTARLDPLVTMKLPVSVPGLTSPWRTVLCLREFSESPQGLNS